MMKQNIILLNASKYEMTDKDTGEINRGVTFRYLTTDDLSPVALDNGNLGIKLAKGNFRSFDNWHMIVSCPAVYEAEMEIVIDKDGKPSLAVRSLTYLHDLKLDNSPKMK